MDHQDSPELQEWQESVDHVASQERLACQEREV